MTVVLGPRCNSRRFMDGYIEQFAGWLSGVRRLSPHTLEAYVGDLRALDEYTEHSPVEHITLSLIRSYTMMMVERGDNPSSINRRITAIRTFFRYLKKMEIVTVNPTLGLHPLPTAKPLPKFIDQSKVRQMAEYLFREDQTFEELRDSLVVVLLYTTGIRRAELATLSLNHIDLHQSTIQVLGKGQKTRKIPLLDSTRKLLERYLQLKNEKNICDSQNNYLLLTNKERPLDVNGIYNIVHRELTLCGVQGQRSPHVLRHTFASHLMQQGASVRTIQELLGHSSLDSTQIYANNTIQQLKEIYSQAHPRENMGEKEQ